MTSIKNLFFLSSFLIGFVSPVSHAYITPHGIDVENSGNMHQPRNNPNVQYPRPNHNVQYPRSNPNIHAPTRVYPRLPYRHRGYYRPRGGYYGPQVIISPPVVQFFAPFCEDMEICDQFGRCWIEEYCE